MKFFVVALLFSVALAAPSVESENDEEENIKTNEAQMPYFPMGPVDMYGMNQMGPMDMYGGGMNQMMMDPMFSMGMGGFGMGGMDMYGYPGQMDMYGGGYYGNPMMMDPMMMGGMNQMMDPMMMGGMQSQGFGQGYNHFGGGCSNSCSCAQQCVPHMPCQCRCPPPCPPPRPPPCQPRCQCPVCIPWMPCSPCQCNNPCGGGGGHGMFFAAKDQLAIDGKADEVKVEEEAKAE